MKRLIQVTSPSSSSRGPTEISAQQPRPTPAPTAASPRFDLRFIRMKISAGDLPSAESILEVHRAEKGEDGEYLLGLAWLARGAALWATGGGVGYAKAARALAVARLGTPPDWENAPRRSTRWEPRSRSTPRRWSPRGRRRKRSRSWRRARRRRRRRRTTCARGSGSDATRSSSSARRRPAIRAEDHLGPEFPGLESLRGKPVVLFFWWDSCGDCKAQAAALRRTVEKYGPKGVAFVAPTRFYERSAPRRRPRSRRPGRRSTASRTPSRSRSATRPCCATASRRRRRSSSSTARASSGSTCRTG